MSEKENKNNYYNLVVRYLSNLIEKKKLDLLFIGIVVAILIYLLNPMVLQGLSPQGVDVVGSIGQSHQLHEYKEETGETPLWNPFIFAGMPKYFRSWPATISFDSIINGIGSLLGHAFIWYVAGAVGIYVLLQYLGFSSLVSLFGALLFVLFPHYQALWIEGHNMKFRAIMIIPWVALSAKYFFDKRTLLSAALFAVIWGNQIRTQHYQIIFYTAFLIMAFGLYPLLMDMIKSNWSRFSRSFLMLLGAICFALLISAQPLFLAKEYLPYSTRGAETVELGKSSENSDAEKEGISWKSATQWSTHPSELLTWIFPHFYGGMSSMKYQGDSYPQLRGKEVPGYWGHMPFTQSYEYFGVITIALAVIGLISRRKDPFIYSLAGLLLFYILLSFGRHLPGFYNLFYNYFPFFNKFRAPVMSVTVSYFVLLLFAANGFEAILTSVSKESMRKFGYYLAGFLGFGVLIWLVSNYMGFIKTGESYNANVLQMIVGIRRELLYNDLVRYFGIIIATGGLITAYIYKKINAVILSLFLIVIACGDLISIQMNKSAKYVNLNRLEKIHFNETQTDKSLKTDNDLFRIFPVGNLFNDNRWAYHHQTIGGYSSIKMNSMEEIIKNNLYNGPDSQFPINWNILRMLNVKYLVIPQNLNHPNLELVNTDRSNGLYTFRFKQFLPRGYFVSNYKVINAKQDRLKYFNTNDFDPLETAIVEQDINLQLDVSKTRTVKLTSFTPNKVSWEISADKDGLFVVSENYYKPGWVAEINGEEVDIYKTNHTTMSMIIPSGVTKLDLIFHPKSHFRYKYLSMLSAGILYALILGCLLLPTIKNKT